jgi:hypothetical protein
LREERKMREMTRREEQIRTRIAADASDAATVG